MEIFKCLHHQFQYYINFAVLKFVFNTRYYKFDCLIIDVDYAALSVCFNVAFITEIRLLLSKNVGDLYVHKCDEGGVKRKQHFAGRVVCHAAIRERRVVGIRYTNARKCVLLYRMLRVTTWFLLTLKIKSRTLSRCCELHFYISISGSTNYDTIHSHERSGVEKVKSIWKFNF